MEEIEKTINSQWLMDALEYASEGFDQMTQDRETETYNPVTSLLAMIGNYLENCTFPASQESPKPEGA